MSHYNPVRVLIAVSFILVIVFVGSKTVQKYGDSQEYTNRLINEVSPYLLQHAHNPVDWYPWSDEAFKIAREQDKPVFLSIGYSTCHWCHVMERESFSDPNVAKVMNENFISIKVDREHRPDIDAVYMKAVQVMTGSGGWPLSVFLTPQGKPFFGGTYFPPVDNYGRRGFSSLLLVIADAWKNDREKLLKSAEELSAFLSKPSQTSKEKIDEKILTDAFDHFTGSFDSVNGGFGISPKFPQTSNLSFLLRFWYRTGNEQALNMVTQTLDSMAKGGIYDHLGGGFHRYSTDAKWFAPHFEKMLYDQALLARIYLQAYQVTADENYADIAKDIFEYVLRDMKNDKGPFYSAEDADSQGREGLFYLWEKTQIYAALDERSAKVFSSYYGVKEQGNFESAKNILYVNNSVESLAGEFEISIEEVKNILKNSRSKLFEIRAKRIRPARDEKIITAWNGLMISSLAQGSAILNEKKYLLAAEKAADFILTNLKKNGRLMRFYAKDFSVQKGFLDDYAFLIMALVDLYHASFDAKWLIEAKALADEMIELFSDAEHSGFSLVGSDSEKLIFKTISDYDGAIPSGNSVSALALLKFGQLTMDSEYTEKAQKILDSFSFQLQQSPFSLTEMLLAVDFHLGPRQEIVIAGDADSADTSKIIKTIYSAFLPNSVILLHESSKQGKKIESVAAFLELQNMIDGRPTVYFCENYACKKPINNFDEFKKLLDTKVRQIK
ncbi:MAG: thioredoxin domain-containing protein [Planctomycetes bacterium]|nr:thioredoxin domain-containing protein [Planctomycetota bacterium]